MRDATFPRPVSEVVTTLAELFRHQSRREVAELLENAEAYFDQIDYDNWNGGTYTWALRLQVPVHIFASIEPRLSTIESDIGAKLHLLDREYPNDHLGEVTIIPIVEGALRVGQRLAPSEIEVRRLWGEGLFRLFLSHVAAHKDTATALRDALALRGIHAFVAHEDIEPSREWQLEIELALRSMHGMVALITPDFHASKWTDQEMGWALGRGVVVLPLRLGADPYGFIQKTQALAGKIGHPRRLAERIARTLLANQQTHGEMRRAVINTFAMASSGDMARALSVLLLSINDIGEEEKKTVWQACSQNDHVKKASGLCDRIYAAIGMPLSSEPSVLTDDDLPF
jgi:hypothetical protein